VERSRSEPARTGTAIAYLRCVPACPPGEEKAVYIGGGIVGLILLILLILWLTGNL
jgi:hypothetical protein